LTTEILETEKQDMVTACQILTEQHVSSVYTSPYELCDAT